MPFRQFQRRIRTNSDGKLTRIAVVTNWGSGLPALRVITLATLSGPRHGGVAALTRHALDAALEGRLKAFLDDESGQYPYRFGFGHPLYPDGDPRAVHLLSQIPKDASARKAVSALSASLVLAPNIDAALADHFRLPEDAASTIFQLAASRDGSPTQSNRLKAVI